MTGTYYDTNETSQMLGRQSYMKIMTEESEKDFKNMRESHRKKKNLDYCDISVDAFMLGYIYGKRAERARRKVVR